MIGQPHAVGAQAELVPISKHAGRVDRQHDGDATRAPDILCDRHIERQVDMVAAALADALLGDATDILGDCPVEQDGRRLQCLQARIDGDRVPLVGPDAVAVDAVAGLGILRDDPQQIVAFDRPDRAMALRTRDWRPPAGLRLPDDSWSVAKNQ